jgi:hypothetical protein
MNRAILLTAFFVAAPFTTGCGGPGEFPVSGTVTWNGQPIPKGQIFFDPDLAKKNDGIQGYALIDNGRFDTRVNGRGIVGGSYVVRVAGFDGKPGAELPLGKPLFAEIRVEWEFPRRQSTIDLALPVKKPSSR